jgi:GT2 family glycosyltransferase
MISIIVLAFNKSQHTRRCLESLLASRDAGWDLTLVDNGSTDDTEEVVRWAEGACRRAGRDFTLLQNPRNLGASTGRNQGIARAESPVLVFLDNDITVGDPLWLSKLRAALDSDPTVAIVVPKLVFADDPAVIQCAGGAVSRTGRVQFIGRGDPARDPRFGVRREIQFGISACMMARRSLLVDVGGFDEAFNPVQFEDVDLCYRARSRGYKVLYEPAVTMLHDESATTAGSPELNNPYVVVKHGLLFKERWRHMFENESGPPDSEIVWKPIGRFARKKSAPRKKPGVDS